MWCENFGSSSFPTVETDPVRLFQVSVSTELDPELDPHPSVSIRSLPSSFKSVVSAGPLPSLYFLVTYKFFVVRGG